VSGKKVLDEHFSFSNCHIINRVRYRQSSVDCLWYHQLLAPIKSRPRTYPFFEDVISYPISRPKKWYYILSYITAKKWKRIYILYPFQFYFSIKTTKFVLSIFILKIFNIQLSLRKVNCEQNMNRHKCTEFFCKYLLTISPHNKCKQKLHCAKDRKRPRQSSNLYCKKDIGYKILKFLKLGYYILQHIPLKKRRGEYPFLRFLDRIWDINILWYISFQCLIKSTNKRIMSWFLSAVPPGATRCHNIASRKSVVFIAQGAT
jgi:hypothetical protein